MKMFQCRVRLRTNLGFWSSESLLPVIAQGRVVLLVCKRASLDSPRKPFKKADFEDGVRVYF